MWRIIFFLFAVLTISMSCGHTNNASTEKATADSVKYYPLDYYWKNQLRDIDSSPFYIYKIITSGNKKDSSEITNTECNALAAYFYTINPDEDHFKKLYKETVFRDESTASITFNYTALNDTSAIRSIDILIDPNTQDVKRVFISKSYNNGDTLITEKAGFKTRANFYINTIKEVKNTTPLQHQMIVVWNQNN